MGCTTTDNTPVYNDTSLSQPGITPSGNLNYSQVTVAVTFDEPVILTAFTINNATQNVTRTDEKNYKVTKTFDDGTYSVTVSAEDPAGNTVSYSADFTVDTELA